jgi:hypothetical protein
MRVNVADPRTPIKDPALAPVLSYLVSDTNSSSFSLAIFCIVADFDKIESIAIARESAT